MKRLEKKSEARKRCAVCKTTFSPFNTMARVCSPKCAITWAGSEASQKHVRKARNVEKRDVRRSLKTKSDWIKDAERAFNRFIRLRDISEPCISCGSTNNRTYMTGSPWDAGHYRSKGSRPELRFEESNVHKQCVKCNRNLSGNVVEYRLRLIDKIGADKLAWLEGPHEPKRYTIEQLKDLCAKYKEKLKEMS